MNYWPCEDDNPEVAALKEIASYNAAELREWEEENAADMVEIAQKAVRRSQAVEQTKLRELYEWANAMADTYSAAPPIPSNKMRHLRFVSLRDNAAVLLNGEMDS